MARRAYAKRYAQAIFEIAREKGELDRWQSDLNKIASLTGDATLVSLLENPKLGFDNKVKVLAQALAGMNRLVVNLVYMLVERGQLSMGGEIAEEYQRLLDTYHGIEPAEVVTAVPIDEETKQSLEERLGTIIGKKVVVRPKVDSSIIGGIVARVGGKLLDGSTRSRLETLKKELGGVRG
ncbi:MAG: F0F1 ATP synthase subunit delta [Chloroflexi bacterium]|nr:F0F1 ATP synthase subunit delta [Chloroflexota bacterium]